MARLASLVLSACLFEATGLDVKCGSYFGIVTANCTFIRLLTSGYIERRDLLPADVCDPTSPEMNMKGKTAADLGSSGEHSDYRYLFYSPGARAGGHAHQIVMDKSEKPLNVSVRATFGDPTPDELLLALKQTRTGGSLYAITPSTLYAAEPGVAAEFEPLADLSSLNLSVSALVAANATANAEAFYILDGPMLHSLQLSADRGVTHQSVMVSKGLEGVVRVEPLSESAELILAISDFPHTLFALNVTSGAAELIPVKNLPTDRRSATRATTVMGGEELKLLDSQGLMNIGFYPGYKTGLLEHELTPIDTEDIIDTFYVVV